MLSKKEIYDELCTVLYNHEQGEYKDDQETVQDMYDILCTIQRTWDDLLNPDIEPLTPL